MTSTLTQIIVGMCLLGGAINVGSLNAVTFIFGGIGLTLLLGGLANAINAFTAWKSGQTDRQSPR